MYKNISIRQQTFNKMQVLTQITQKSKAQIVEELIEKEFAKKVGQPTQAKKTDADFRLSFNLKKKIDLTKLDDDMYYAHEDDY